MAGEAPHHPYRVLPYRMLRDRDGVETYKNGVLTPLGGVKTP
jgi:hypothetical protein